jgi:hypothetical protein
MNHLRAVNKKAQRIQKHVTNACNREAPRPSLTSPWAARSSSILAGKSIPPAARRASANQLSAISSTVTSLASGPLTSPII